MSGTLGDTAIQTRGLTKRFGRRTVVDHIDLAVPSGSVFGFLGPNGAGKTTTIRMLLGLVHPLEGEVRLLGTAMPAGARAVLPRVGALVEGPGFSPHLTGRANLLRLDAADPGTAQTGRVDRVEAALDRVGLGLAGRKKVSGYSLGMRSRLGLALTLLAPHALLVLDEPTNGLDPQGTREVRTLIRELASDGTTVFLSSHLLAEIEQMCSHAAVMRSGRLVAQGSLDDLGSGRRTLVVDTADPDRVAQGLRQAGLDPARTEPGAGTRGGRAPRTARLTATMTADAPDLAALLTRLVEGGARISSYTVEASSLEDRYVTLTGEGFEVDG